MKKLYLIRYTWCNIYKPAEAKHYVEWKNDRYSYIPASGKIIGNIYENPELLTK